MGSFSELYGEMLEVIRSIDRMRSTIHKWMAAEHAIYLAKKALDSFAEANHLRVIAEFQMGAVRESIWFGNEIYEPLAFDEYDWSDDERRSSLMERKSHLPQPEFAFFVMGYRRRHGQNKPSVIGKI